MATNRPNGEERAAQDLQRPNGVNQSIWQHSPLPKGNLHHVLRPVPAKRGMLSLRPLPKRGSKVRPAPAKPDPSPPVCLGQWDPHELAAEPELTAASDEDMGTLYDLAVNTPPAFDNIPEEEDTIPGSAQQRSIFGVITSDNRNLSLLDRVDSCKSTTPSASSLNPLSPAPLGAGTGEVLLSKHEEAFLKQRRASLESLASEDSVEDLLSRTGSDGENSKARWAKAHWYAMQKAGGSQHEKSVKHVGGENAEKGDTLANMVNVVVFAMHWRQKALGGDEEKTPREQPGGRSPYGGKSPGGRSPFNVRGGPQKQQAWYVPYLAVLRGVARGLLTLYILVGWDVNVLLDDSGAADAYLYRVSAALFVLIGAETAYLLARRRMHVWSWQCLLDVASLCSLLPEAVYAVSEFDLLGAGGHPRWPVAIRALRAGFRLSVRVGYISYLLHKHAQSASEDRIPEHLRAQIENSSSKPVRVAVSALVDLQTAVVVAFLLFAHFLLKLIFPPRGLAPEQGTHTLLDLLCQQAASSSAGAASGPGLGPDALISAAQGWEHPLLHLELCGRDVVGAPAALDALRSFPSALLSYAATAGNGCTCALHVDGSAMAREEAAESLVLVFAVVAIIVGATRLMRTLFDRELVGPLEAMQERVVAMLRKPMRVHAEPDHRQVQESFVVDRVLTRFSSLVRISLGEAGGKIVTANLTDGLSIDRSLPGKIVNGIFGFCDIRNFTDLTEVLQADVIKLVNTVALHVHEAVTANYGTPNKNIGDAFLLVWKPNRGRQVQEVADAALKSLVDMIVSMRRSSDLMAIAKRPDVQKRMPGYSVHLGFGLHYGWAVEGAIGSNKKIDASYLSPHVNLAARLESATKQFGVPILLSESMRTLLSPAVQSMLRLVDRVVVKGASTPMRLYTFDVWNTPDSARSSDATPMTVVDEAAAADDCVSTSMQRCCSDGSAASAGLSPAPARASAAAEGGIRGNADSEGSANKHRGSLPRAGRSMSNAAEALCPSSSFEYRRDFLEAMEWYLGGEHGINADWTKASALLKDCRSRCPEDGAAKAMLEVIESLATPQGHHPADWKGYRNLTEK